MKKAFFGLTAVELELMEMFWNAGEPMSFRQIMEYLTTELQKDWKKQTLNTYLSNMQKTGLLKAERGKGYYQSYSAAYTKEEYVQQWTRKLVEDSYGNSISNFVAAFTGGESISEEEAERLRKLLR